MEFSFTQDQNLLRQSIREFLTKECDRESVIEMEEDEKGYTQELWHGMGELGWMGVIFPEKYGGTEGDFLDLVVMMEEMGRFCLPGPFFSTVVLGGLAILESGNESQLSDFLTKIASGEMVLTLAINEPANKNYDSPLITVTATAKQNHYIINGIKLFVPDANVADYIICAARTKGEPDSREGITLFLIDAKSPGIKCAQLKTMAGNKECEVTFDKVEVPETYILGELHNGWNCIEKILQKASVAKCAEMVGGAQKVLEMTVKHAKQRVQFDRPIGSFQAVQHHCANMAIDVDCSRYLTYQVAWMLNEGIPCEKEAAMAKAYTSDAYVRVAMLGQQVHGGTGLMKDQEMQLYYRRAKAAALSLGTATFQRKIVARELDLV